MAASSSSSAPASSRRKSPCSLNCSAFEARPAAPPPSPPPPPPPPPPRISPPPLTPLPPIPGFHPQEKIHEETIQSAGLDAGHCLPGRLGHLDRMGATDARQAQDRLHHRHVQPVRRPRRQERRAGDTDGDRRLWRQGAGHA